MNKSEIEKEIYKVGFESIDAYKQYLNEVVRKKYYNYNLLKFLDILN